MTKPEPAGASPSGLFSALFAQPYLLLVLTPLFWAGNWVAGKLAVGTIDPVMLVTARFGLSFLVIAPFAAPHVKRDWQKIAPALPLLLAYGGIGFAGFNALLYTGAQSANAINGAIEQALIPVLVMLGSFVFFSQRARALQLAGVVLTVLGVAYTAAEGDLSRLLSLTVNEGDGLVLLAGIAYASYSLALRYRPPIHWLSFLAVTMFGAFAVAALFQLATGHAPAEFASLAAMPARGWLIVVYVAIFPSIISQLFYARGVELIGANRASLFINLLPVFATALSVVIIGERIQGFHAIAGVLVIAGIAMAEWSARRS